MDKLICTSYTILSEDGVHLRCEETPERDQIVISLSRQGKIETARLSFDEWDALHEMRYKLECVKNEVKEEEYDRQTRSL